MDAARERMARLNRTSRDAQTGDMFGSPTRQQELPLRKPTPAWLAHRLGLSDTPRTPEKAKAKHRYLAQQAEKSFKRWHEECQKRKQRKQVMIAKKQTPKRGKSAATRKPPSRLRCP